MARAPSITPRRFQIEFKTLKAMTRFYCRDHHQAKELCSECQTFLNYAEQRLLHCTFGAHKPACSECPVHCYKPAERKLAKTIMTYAGPKMPLRHPILSILHFWFIWRSPAYVELWEKRRKQRSLKK